MASQKPLDLQEALRAIAGLGFAAFLLYLSYRFMNFSLAALARDTPYVTAGIMSAFFALLSLSGAIMLARDYILSKKVSKDSSQR